MNTSDFTGNGTIKEIINKLKNDLPDKIYSDVVDAKGHQYVDLVQEGGGVLGIALLGYTYVLEQVGIRFFSLGGTSAGAINTLLLAAVDEVSKPKTEKIIELIANKNLYDFVDGPFFVKLLLKTIGSSKEIKFLPLRLWIKFLKIIWIIIWFIPVLIYLLIKKGLNTGENFQIWIKEILSSNNITSTKALNDRRVKPGDLRIRDGVYRTAEDLVPGLKIIAAEITTETRVLFPEMNKLFWSDPDKTNPADYVRASMSIPIFFHPFKIKTGYINKNDWLEIVKYKGEPPEESVFVDGGVLSNFPIDVFHNPNKIPRLPTFGVKLGDDRDKTSSVKSITKFLMAIFNSARHVLDYQFLLKNKDYENLIQKIDIGEHNWLNFSISDDDKLDLFIRGAQAAEEFLNDFNWQKYKEIRGELIGTGNNEKSQTK